MADQHGIIGDNFGTDLPVSEIPEKDLALEKNMARFSKTEEFEKLKEHLEQRIEFYQQFLPDGRNVNQVSSKELEGKWVIANAIIGEFNAVIQAYETAAQVIKDQQDK